MDTLLTIILWLALVVVAGVVLFTSLKIRYLTRKYGTDPMPDDIKLIVDSFGKTDLSLVVEDFTVDYNKGDTQVLSRRYIRNKGTWELKVEFNGSKWVGYSAQYYSRYSTWINHGIERSMYPAQVIGAPD